MTKPRVEILYFEGCPNYETVWALVDRIAAQLRVELEVDFVEVADAARAAELRFLGSPTVRVDGRDVEPGADERHDFVFACRMYRSKHGVTGEPDEAWVRDALAEAVTQG